MEMRGAWWGGLVAAALGCGTAEDPLGDLAATVDNGAHAWAPASSEVFAGVAASVTLTVPLQGQYRITYDTASEYSIEGMSPWIPNSAGPYTYRRRAANTADMEFQDSRAGTVRCGVTYTSATAGNSACTYPNGVTLQSRFTVP